MFKEHLNTVFDTVNFDPSMHKAVRIKQSKQDKVKAQYKKQSFDAYMSALIDSPKKVSYLQKRARSEAAAAARDKAAKKNNKNTI